jgi:hypothetical protein
MEYSTTSIHHDSTDTLSNFSSKSVQLNEYQVLLEGRIVICQISLELFNSLHCSPYPSQDIRRETLESCLKLRVSVRVSESKINLVGEVSGGGAITLIVRVAVFLQSLVTLCHIEQPNWFQDFTYVHCTSSFEEGLLVDSYSRPVFYPLCK